MCGPTAPIQSATGARAILAAWRLSWHPSLLNQSWITAASQKSQFVKRLLQYYENLSMTPPGSREDMTGTCAMRGRTQQASSTELLILCLMSACWMASSAAARLRVLQAHLDSGEAEAHNVQRAHCDSAEPSGKVVSAEDAAQLVPDGASVTVSALYNSPHEVSRSSATCSQHPDAFGGCHRCLASWDPVIQSCW